MDQVNLNAAGIDVGATDHYVAVPQGRDTQAVQRFDAFTADLYRLADWLKICKIETVAMESTGVYWIPLFEILEARGFQVFLVDPRRLKHVPGRKTDVLDCQWIQKLHTFGLLAAAFRPDDQICILRGFLRQRSMLVSYSAQHIQHMQKALTQMNVKLQHVVNDITGLTGMRIIKSILDGQQNPKKLAQLRHHRCKKSEQTIAKALQGNWRQEHLFQLHQAVELFEFYGHKIAECDQKIQAHLRTFEQCGQDGELAKKKRSKGLNFDAQELLLQMSGVDLTAIDGISALTALKLISEIGTDMSRWPSVKHFASWLGLCPGSKVSGGRMLNSRSKRCANRAAAALRLSANGLFNSKSALGAFLRRKRAQLGAPKAITATAHKLARLVYSMLRYGSEYVDQGQRYYEQQYRKRAIRNLRRNAQRFGFQIIESSAG
jgi:transposase